MNVASTVFTVSGVGNRFFRDLSIFSQSECSDCFMFGVGTLAVYTRPTQLGIQSLNGIDNLTGGEEYVRKATHKLLTH